VCRNADNERATHLARKELDLLSASERKELLCSFSTLLFSIFLHAFTHTTNRKRRQPARAVSGAVEQAHTLLSLTIVCKFRAEGFVFSHCERVC